MTRHARARPGLRGFPSPLVGEGARAKRRRVRGLSPRTDPSSGTDFVRATFSHKGRREEEPPHLIPKRVSPNSKRSPDGANGSRECAPDDRLREIRGHIRRIAIPDLWRQTCSAARLLDQQ